MNAASYVGRVGGLAVALGIGAAIITGQGIAVATADGDTSPENSQTGDGSGDKSATVKDNAPDDVRKIAVKPTASPTSSGATARPIRRPAPSRPHRSSSGCRTLLKTPSNG